VSAGSARAGGQTAGEPDVVHVVIVGAGPVGSAAALLLARQGINSVLLERFPEIYPLPRAVHLDDEVLRILQQAGIAEDFLKVSRPTQGLQLVDGAQRVLARFTRDRLVGDHGYPEANMFDQPDLEALLRARVVAEPRIRLITGVEVTGVDQDTPGPAPVGVSYHGESGEPQTIWGHAVLGCDGANSTVRSLIGSTWTDMGFQERWFIIDVRCPIELDAWDGVHQVCDPRRPGTYMRVGPERYRWEFKLADGEDPTTLLAPDRLAELLAPWTRDIPAEHLEVLRTAEYVFRARIADRWRNRRVFLLGDAAHLTPPFIGQGLCAGVRDAQNLAWKLALVLHEGADERLLDSYQAERVPHARTLIRLAVQLGWMMNGGRYRAATVRRVVLAVLGRTPGFSAVVLSSAVPPLRRGPLVVPLKRVRSVVGKDLPGTLVPQPWVTADGREQRLDDLLGSSFALLADGRVKPGLLALARRLGAPVLQLDPAVGAKHGRLVESADLRRWLARRGAGAVLVRPDRVVLMAQPRAARAARRTHRAAAAGWTHWMPPVRSGTVS
jgi:3-(3-hydroxy-phenyl)propionate hydroxylase